MSIQSDLSVIYAGPVLTVVVQGDNLSKQQLSDIVKFMHILNGKKWPFKSHSSAYSKSGCQTIQEALAYRNSHATTIDRVVTTPAIQAKL